MTDAQKNNLRRLVEELRSGRWRQGHRALWRKRKDGSRGFCCLGVALKIKEPNSRFLNPNDDGSCSTSPMPPMSFMEKEYGLTDGRCFELAEMNDGGDSFEKIASVIEGWIK